jgi:hypothetical protein
MVAFAGIIGAIWWVPVYLAYRAGGEQWDRR